MAENRTPAAGSDPPHVVVVGAGFGGLACAAALGGRRVRVTVVDRRNYHLFQPLLYQVATAALSPADIAEPIRKIFRRHGNVDVVLAEVVGVDTALRRVLLADGGFLPYDRLVIATGSAYNYFGHDDWAALAPALKTIEDARRIRTQLLMSFEKAEMIDDPARQAALMTAVVIGGGPTGVELAGSIAELARHTLARDFRRIDPASARILLVEAGPRILPGFAAPLSDYARRAVERLGVTVLTGQPVDDIGPDGVTVAGRFIPAGTVLWGAGVKASPVAAWLRVGADRAGRVAVAPDLSVPGAPAVYIVGDAALVLGEDGKPLPGLAQVAKQQGRHVGRALAGQMLHGRPMPPFRFRPRGNTAIIGRNAAVFEIGRYQLRGRLAWLLWAIVHVYLLVGMEHRVLVTLQWLWRYVTYQRGARLITGDTSAARPAEAPARRDGTGRNVSR